MVENLKRSPTSIANLEINRQTETPRQPRSILFSGSLAVFGMLILMVENLKNCTQVGGFSNTISLKPDKVPGLTDGRFFYVEIR